MLNTRFSQCGYILGALTFGTAEWWERGVVDSATRRRRLCKGCGGGGVLPLVAANCAAVAWAFAQSRYDCMAKTSLMATAELRGKMPHRTVHGARLITIPGADSWASSSVRKSAFAGQAQRRCPRVSSAERHRTQSGLSPAMKDLATLVHTPAVTSEGSPLASIIE